MEHTDSIISQSAPVASFFSQMQLRRLRRTQMPKKLPSSESHSGAFLFLDLVAFTRLGEELSVQGVKGAEILSDILHAYYRPILATVQDHGGDVLFFAGDALGVVWLANDNDVTMAAARAAQCALAIQNLVPRIESPWSQPLSFRASIGVGPFEALEVGGVDENWMQLVRGTAIDLACSADAQGVGGTVILSHTCAQKLAKFSPKFTTLANGLTQVDRLDTPPPIQSAQPLDILSKEETALGQRLTEAVRRHLYYPSSAVTAEFRRTTVLFADISGADPETLHGAVRAAQEDVSRFGGVVYHLLEDDKGTNLIIVFGLPGNTHADDPLRALLLAKKLSADFARLGLAPRLGIASGTAFCGTLGTSERQQYSLIGSSVNLAARLMSLAESGEIYCDNQTRRLADAEFEFGESAWTTPKGFSEPVPVFKPGERRVPDTQSLTDVAIVGRDSESALIAQEVDDIRAGGPSRIVLICAEAGMGKSAILQMAGVIVDQKGLNRISGAADAIDTGTSYFALRNIARTWCGIAPDDTAEQAYAKLEILLSDAPDLLPLIPLLDPVVGYDFPQTSVTETLRGQTRSENTQRLLLHVAQKSMTDNQTVLLIEDGHWMDGASWQFLERLVEDVKSVLVIMSSRPVPEDIGDAGRILAKDITKHIDLSPITRQETEEMVRRQLAVPSVESPVLDLVYERSEGNPLFVREIVRNLVEAGDIKIRNLNAQLMKRRADAEPVPDTLEGVITSRIDRLEADAQITIKAAAVLGRSFEGGLLLDIHPLAIDRPYLEEQLSILKKNGFLNVDANGENYAFHHALTRDAAYNLLAFSQRESLHASTAQALEVKHTDNTEQVNGRLGYHFKMAGNTEKAAFYLGAAGETALDAYASQDAIDLLTDALALDEAHRGTEVGVDLSRAYWSKLIGQAYYNQDNQSEAANWYRRAIDNAGTAPRYKIGSIFPTLMRTIFKPASLDCPPAPDLTEEDRIRITHGMAAARELGTIYLWESAVDKFALNAVNLVRLATIVGPTNESANAIVTIAFMMSSAGMRAKSEKLAENALHMALEFGDEEQLIGVQVISGMVFVQNGSPRKSLPQLQAAEAAGSALISGIWRHRSKYMLADAHTWLGDYETGYALFLEAAVLSHSAEPHAVGQANAMAALNLIRLGRPQEAIDLLEGPDGVPNALECGVPASAIMALGVLAEAKLAVGLRDEAVALAAQAEAQVTAKDDGTGYYSGLFGYSSILNVRLETGEFGTGSGKGTAVDDDLKRARKLTKVAPLGSANEALWAGLYAAQTEQTSKARKLLQKAIDAATAAEQPFELGRSLVALAELSHGPEKQQLLDRAITVFKTNNMPLELARAQAAQ